MLVATGLWVVSMPLMFAVSYFASERRVMAEGGRHVVVDGAIIDADTYRSQAVANAMLSGLCCPTIPFAVAMVVLGIVYFTTRPGR
jgi:hypothetical protein